MLTIRSGEQNAGELPEGSALRFFHITAMPPWHQACRALARLLCWQPQSKLISHAICCDISVHISFEPACSTPSVLMSNGDAWELQHCDCQVSDSISCGSEKTDRMLAGYSNWRCAFRSH